MLTKIRPLFFLFLFITLSFCVEAQTEEQPSPPEQIRPKNKSFSTYIVIDGFTQNIRIGLENSQYYSLTNFFGALPIATLKFVCSRKHSFGLKFGINNHSESFLRTDSIFNNTYISTIKMARTIMLNSNYVGLSQDEFSANTKSLTLIPFYEFHFKGTKRWDYYLAAEYLFDISMTPKSKNHETLIYTNNNNDRIEYTYKSTKSGYLRNHGPIATAGINYFIYRWLSVGTKLSLSKQFSSLDNNSSEEKLLVNGVDRTNDLNISNVPQFKNYKTSNTSFLNGNGGGFISTFFLPVLINFYL